MTANAGSSTWLAWSDNVAQSLADADHGTIRLSVELRSGRIVIAGVKQSCGRKCARLVDWLSFLPISQIIGKGAPRFSAECDLFVGNGSGQFASAWPGITCPALGRERRQLRGERRVRERRVTRRWRKSNRCLFSCIAAKARPAGPAP